MTDLKLSFDFETMLRLTGEQYNRLSTTGETITAFAPAKDYWIDGQFSRLFLSFDNSPSSYCFEFEPQEVIDMFLKNAFLTHFFPKTGKIELIKDFEEPLFDLLRKKCLEATNLPQIDKFKFVDQQDIFLDPLNDSAVETLVRTGYFKGQISCCECGESECSSEYL